MPPSEEQFSEFVRTTEPRLHRALAAQLGWDRGREATAEALAYAWEHWDRVNMMSNSAGYLFRVGKSRVRRRKTRILFIREADEDRWFEPALGRSLSLLPERQRVAVVLVHGYGWTSREVAEVTGIKATTVQSHLERGLARLRSQLEVERSERD
jgi:DNA-directed RNA polymerase specialized sigma24 family protein